MCRGIRKIELLWRPAKWPSGRSQSGSEKIASTNSFFSCREGKINLQGRLLGWQKQVQFPSYLERWLIGPSSRSWVRLIHIPLSYTKGFLSSFVFRLSICLNLGDWKDWVEKSRQWHLLRPVIIVRQEQPIDRRQALESWKNLMAWPNHTLTRQGHN